MSQDQNQYENETCEGCVMFRGKGRACAGNPVMPAGPDRIFRYSAICDDFAPSVECRKVRALEEVAGSLLWIGYVQGGGRHPPVETPGDQ